MLLPESDDPDAVAAWCDRALVEDDRSLSQWRYRIVREPVAMTLARTPTTRYVTVRLDIKAVSLASQVAKGQGMSRERWLRTVILAAISSATDLPIESLAGSLPVGADGG